MMAKKRTKTRSAVVEDTDGVSVHVSLGAKCSINYSSMDFNVGATSNVQPGESIQDALERTRTALLDYFDEHDESTYDALDKTINKQKRR